MTDAALLMFDKPMGTLARRAERGATESTAGALRDAGAHLRLLARASRAVIAAREGGTDAAGTVERPWAGRRSSAPSPRSKTSPSQRRPTRAALVERWSSLRAFAPALLEVFEFEGAPGTRGVLGTVALPREMNASGKRVLPADAPTGFVRRGWRPFVTGADGRPDRRA